MCFQHLFPTRVNLVSKIFRFMDVMLINNKLHFNALFSTHVNLVSKIFRFMDVMLINNELHFNTCTKYKDCMPMHNH